MNTGQAPAGYRYVYGQLEKIPEPAGSPEWETTDFSRFELDECEMEETEGAKWEAVGPDRENIHADGRTYATPAEAMEAIQSWCKQYRSQGGYRDGNGYFIPYGDLFYKCDIEPVEE